MSSDSTPAATSTGSTGSSVPITSSASTPAAPASASASASAPAPASVPAPSEAVAADGAGSATGEASGAGAGAGAASDRNQSLIPVTLRDGGVNLVVWDFDLTILKVHSWGERISPDSVAKRDWEADFADLKLFRELVTCLKANGVKVAVASFGLYETIQNFLNLAFPDGTFTRENISTPTTVGGKDGWNVKGGKVPQLNELTGRLGVAKEFVMFFDDDLKNVTGARDEGYVGAFHTPDGFTKKVWDQMMEEFKE